MACRAVEEEQASVQLSLIVHVAQLEEALVSEARKEIGISSGCGGMADPQHSECCLRKEVLVQVQSAGPSSRNETL